MSDSEIYRQRKYLHATAQLDRDIVAGNREEAIRLLAMLKTEFPNEQEVFVKEAEFYMRSRSLEDAITAIRRAIALQESAPLLSKLGTLLEEVAKNATSKSERRSCLEEAADCFRRALQRDDGFPNTAFNLGSTLLYQGKVALAYRYYRKAAQIDPRYQPAYNGLGFVYHVYKRYDDAMHCFQTAIDLKADDGSAYVGLASALMRLGRFPEAIPAYKQALSMEPDRIKWLRGLAEAYEKAGNVHNALGVHKHIVDLMSTRMQRRD